MKLHIHNVTFAPLSTDPVRNAVLSLFVSALRLVHCCCRSSPVALRVLVTFVFVLRPAGGDMILLVFVSHFKVQSPSAIPSKDAAAASWLQQRGALEAALNLRFLKVLVGYFCP